MTVHIVAPQGPSSSFQLRPEEPSNLEWHTHIARVCGQVFLECFDIIFSLLCKLRNQTQSEMEYIERRLPLRFIDGNLGASCVVDEGRKSGKIFQF